MEKAIKKASEDVRSSIAKYCRLSVNKGLCQEDDCEYCPVGLAFEMLRDKADDESEED